MPELYDWQADTRHDWDRSVRPSEGAQMARREPGPVWAPQATDRLNAVNGHGAGCECPQCPGWYNARARAGVPLYGPGVVPPEQRPRPLLDQVVPVMCLMAMVTVCGLVLVPVVVPVLAIGVTALVVALVVLAVTLVGVLAVFGRTSVRRDAAQGVQVVRGHVVRTRRGWRR